MVVNGTESRSFKTCVPETASSPDISAAEVHGPYQIQKVSGFASTCLSTRETITTRELKLVKVKME